MSTSIILKTGRCFLILEQHWRRWELVFRQHYIQEYLISLVRIPGFSCDSIMADRQYGVDH